MLSKSEQQAVTYTAKKLFQLFTLSTGIRAHCPLGFVPPKPNQMIVLPPQYTTVAAQLMSFIQISCATIKKCLKQCSQTAFLKGQIPVTFRCATCPIFLDYMVKCPHKHVIKLCLCWRQVW